MLDNKVVVITGAGGGLGREHALLCARYGARVVVNDLGGDVHGSGHDASRAAGVVEEIRAAGGDAVANHESITTSAGGEALISTAVEHYGTVDALVHNAGILRDRSLLKLADNDIEAVLDVHLRGAFNVLRPAMRVMTEQSFGRVVLTTSSSGLIGNFGQANYGAAKMGLVGLTRIAAIEGRRHGIVVNALAPGALTRMTDGLLQPELESRLEPSLVSPMVAFLCSAVCESSGDIYSAAGGRFARFFVGVNEGWYGGSQPASARQIAEHLGEIRDVSKFHQFDEAAQELSLLEAAINARSATGGDAPRT